MSDTSLRFRQSSGPLESQVSGDEVVILDPSSGAYFGLDGVGNLVWRELGSGSRTLGELVEAVVSVYLIDDTTCRADIEALLAELVAAGLVTTDA